MPTSIVLDDELKGRVEHLAHRRGRSRRWVMREAIRQYVEREEARESFVREARESWEDYQKTGRHLEGSEVRDWLDTWGTEAETEPPECHE